MHGNAAHGVEQGFKAGHINGHIVIHRQLELIVDHRGQIVDIVFLIGAVGIAAVDLAVGDKSAVTKRIFAHKAIARDLQNVNGVLVTVDLHIHDHIGQALAVHIIVQAVVGIGVIVDAHHQQVIKAFAVL